MEKDYDNLNKRICIVSTRNFLHLLDEFHYTVFEELGDSFIDEIHRFYDIMEKALLERDEEMCSRL